MKTTHRTSSSRGTVLMLVVVSAFVMSIVGMGSISLMGMQEISARAEIDVARVQHMADAGIELGRIWISSVSHVTSDSTTGHPYIDFDFPEIMLYGAQWKDHAGEKMIENTVNLGKNGTVTYSIVADTSNVIGVSGSSKYGSYKVTSMATINEGVPGACVTRKTISQSIELIRQDKPQYIKLGSSLSPVRGATTCTLLDDGRVLYAGGDTLSGSDYSEGDDHAVRNVDVFDPKGNGGRGSFTAMAPLVVAREEHTATKLKNGTILIAGGFDGNNELDSVEIYDPYANGGLGKSTLLNGPTQRMTDRRMCHCAVYLPLTDEVLILGGFNNRDANTGILNSADVFSAAKNEFILSSVMTAPRHCFNCTILRDENKVYVPGGRTESAWSYNGVDEPTNIVEIYDRTTNTFTVVPDRLSAGRLDACSILMADGRVLTVGGHDDDERAVSTVDIYDPSDNSIRKIPEKMSQPRADVYLSYMPTGDHILISGGVYKTGDPIPYVEEFNPNPKKDEKYFTAWDAKMVESVESENNSCATLSNGGTLFAGGWTRNSGAKTAQLLFYAIINKGRQSNTYIEGPTTRGVE